MFNKLLERLGISPKPEETRGSGNPDRVEVSAAIKTVAIETAKKAMEGLAESTLKAISRIREMVSSIGLTPLPEVMQKAYEGLRFVIGWLTTPFSNTVSGSATD